MPAKQMLSAILAVTILIIAITAAGCDETPASSSPQKTGTLIITSVPSGAGIYLDNEYRGTTPATLISVPAGSHVLELRKDGFTPYSSPVTITGGSDSTVTAQLSGLPPLLPVIVATTTQSPVMNNLPRIHVDGYWTQPPGRESTENPVPLLVHTEAFNVGTADAREVIVSANFYYAGRQVCWNTIYIGTLAAGGHLSRDSLISCTLPSGFERSSLEIRFENVIVT